MNCLKDIVVTDIYDAITVFSKKGRKFKVENRYAYGLSFCQKGQITYTLDGKEYISDTSNAILLPHNRSYTLYGNAEGYFPLINFKTDKLVTNTFQLFPISSIEPYIKDFEKIKSLLLFNESKPIIYSLFYKIIDRLIKEEKTENNILYPSIQFLRKNISNPELNNGILAAQSNISEIYFRKLFLKYYGTTPKQYILDLRIQKSKQMLTDTPYSVTTISEKCGFSSVYHFCRTFKEKNGITATEYANQNRIYKI